MSKKVIYQPKGEVSLVNDDFKVHDSLSPNFYHIEEVDMGMYTKREVRIDESVLLPSSSEDSYKKHFNTKYLLDYFSEGSIQIHKSLNVKHKFGALLHGKQGTGKTTMCYALAKYLLKEKNAVVFTVNDLAELIFALNFCKQADPEETIMKVMIMDECDYDMCNNESTFKRLLDSATSPNNCLFLFTTNYYEEIPETITDRPSRIRWVREVKGYDDEAEIFEVMLNLNETLGDNVKLTVPEIKSLVPQLMDKTIDEIKHMFVDLVLKLNLRKLKKGQVKQLSA